MFTHTIIDNVHMECLTRNFLLIHVLGLPLVICLGRVSVLHSSSHFDRHSVKLSFNQYLSPVA